MQQQVDFDVVIIGAGLSGIGAGYHIQSKCPGKTYTILEGRGTMGGTWDLFRYPGIRSDSDMYTLGFSFNPWENAKAIADGPSILQYIKDTAQKFGIDQKIKYHTKALSAEWKDETRTWTIETESGGVKKSLSCRFLFTCSGYYDYDEGYLPEFKNMNSFKGNIVHPQKWTDAVDYTDKEVVIVGSGATAVTLLPELAKKAKHTVMLQRSPTYIIRLPSQDGIARFFQKWLPSQTAYELARWKNILFSLTFYNASRKWPQAVRNLILKGVRREMGEGYDLKHFSPKYNPWDQRLCVVPDGDLFEAVKSGKAEIVTDEIDSFCEEGIRLRSGKTLPADLIVTATGLKLKLLGGMYLKVNGKQIQPQDIHCYRGVMFSDIPNFAIAVGYTNSSWTLKCDLNCDYVARLINYMDSKNYHVCTPRFDSNKFKSEPLLDFDAGYVLRAKEFLPKQGSAAPWKVYQNYLKDSIMLRLKPLADRYLEFR